jgi:hypothetical protein
MWLLCCNSVLGKEIKLAGVKRDYIGLGRIGRENKERK